MHSSRQNIAALSDPHWLQQFEVIIERFETAWRHGGAPEIADYLPGISNNSRSATQRRRLLQELIAIDLELRWKAAAGGGPNPWRLEDYLQAFTELGALESVPQSLIIEEWLARQRWGGNASDEEFI